jgi:hypothetical protein
MLELGLQALLLLAVDGEGPVRFGFPLPAAALARGLRVEGACEPRLQWRPLQPRPDPVTGRQWVELAIAPAQGTLRVVAGGAPAFPDAGPILLRSSHERRDGDLQVRELGWRWATGEEDRVTIHLCLAAHEVGGELLQAGESWRDGAEAADCRWRRVRIEPAAWTAAGVLPPGRNEMREWRDGLVRIGLELRELGGLRGEGDFGRARGVVTNLEFDTALGFLRLGLAASEPRLVQRGVRSARHLADHDLDLRSGLPFRHGQDHRSGRPEPGHAWLQGLLLAGCLAADETLIAAARLVADGLAMHPRLAEPESDDRARDLGWPLLELESWLRFHGEARTAAAADRLALALLQRWDPEDAVLRFGEGETKNGAYDERLWITGGILLPALRAHARRRPSPDLAQVVAALERRILDLVRNGRPGLPLRCWVRHGQVVGQFRARGRPEGFLLLDGLAEKDLLRCLGRDSVRSALLVPREDDPDLATSFSIAARCGWVLR